MASKRIILHVDVNSAFLSWTALDMLERGAQLDVRTVPAIVGGDEKSRRGIVLAKSTPAKAYGIVTGETLLEARRKCPNLLVLPSEYSIYTKHSDRMYKLLCHYSPIIQRYSIDECFLDYTGMEHLRGTPEACGEEIRRRCEQELGFTVNVGIGPNKALAKMAGELRKPNFVNTLYQHELEQKLWVLPIRELFMVGRATEQTLHRYGVRTIGDFAKMDPNFVRQILKKHGMMIWGYANGIDASAVIPNEQTAPKSISNAATLKTNAETKQAAYTALLPLCDSVAERMRRQGYACRLVGVQIKYDDFQYAQHQRSLIEPTSQTRAIFQQVQALFDELWNGKPIRLLGVKLAELMEPACEQLTLEDAKKQQAHTALDRVADQIRKKYGRHGIMPASMLENDFKHLDRYKK